MFNDALYECPSCHSNNILERERKKTESITCACGDTFSSEDGFCQLLRSSDPMMLGAVTSHTVIFDEITITTPEPIPVRLPSKIWQVRQILTDPHQGVDTCFVNQEGFSIVVSREKLIQTKHSISVKWFVFAILSPPKEMWTKLLGDALEYHYKDAFDISIIYAITALDTELSEVTKWLISRGDRVTLSDKLVAFTQAIGKNERARLKPLLEKTRKIIKIRNQLVHNRKKLQKHALTWDNSMDAITSVYRMIKNAHRIFKIQE